MNIRYLIAAILTVLALVLVPGTAFAYDPNEKDYAPPQFDKQFASLWINTHPLARPYLARIWDIDPRVARFYSTWYKPLGYGEPVSEWAQIKTIPDQDPPGFIFKWTTILPESNDPGAYGIWAADIKNFQDFVPIPITYFELPKTEPVVIKYDDAPPQLDMVQAARWHQALPSARKYLANLWGISNEEAEKYGAR